MKQNVTARPCKENNTWEIVEPNGKVCNKHYQTKNECVEAAKEMANEFGCELNINDNKSNANNANNINNNNNTNNNVNNNKSNQIKN